MNQLQLHLEHALRPERRRRAGEVEVGVVGRRRRLRNEVSEACFAWENSRHGCESVCEYGVADELRAAESGYRKR